MLSDAVLETAKELIRQSEAGTLAANALSVHVLKLLRATALSSRTPAADVADVRFALEIYADRRARPVIEGVSARVLDAVDSGHTAKYLDALVEQLGDSDTDLVEQASDMLVAGDVLVVLPQRTAETGGAAGDDGNVIERAIANAAELLIQERHNGVTSIGTGTGTEMKKKKKNEGKGEDDVLSVMVVRVYPDDGVDYKDEDGDEESMDGGGSADRMARRLNDVRGVKASVVDDYMVARSMRQCSKVIVYASMLDVDEGLGCTRGSALVIALANRMRVPTIAVCSRYRIMPMGSRCVAAMACALRAPGKVWAYEGARDDAHRESVAVVAPLVDVVQMHKIDTVVVETGGYAPDYVVHLMPAYERAAVTEDDEGEGEGEERERHVDVDVDVDGDGEDRETWEAAEEIVDEQSEDKRE